LDLVAGFVLTVDDTPRQGNGDEKANGCKTYLEFSVHMSVSPGYGLHKQGLGDETDFLMNASAYASARFTFARS
jgi:hypothetical protein